MKFWHLPHPLESKYFKMKNGFPPLHRGEGAGGEVKKNGQLIINCH
jgi:hypothetical protein